jgi:hypothetical protein
MGIKEQCGCREHIPEKSAELEKDFDRHRKEPLAIPAPGGFCRLLPQLVGSCDPGGGVSGDGVPPGLAY